MSLCIAAACKHNDQPRIVLCFDLMLSTDVSSSEVEIKIDRLPLGLIVLMAGVASEYRELLGIYKSELKDAEKLNEDSGLERLRVPLRIRKQRMIESYVQARLGISYEDFLSRSDKIDVAVRSAMFNRIHDMNVNVEMAIAGFGEKGRTLLYKLAWDEVVPYRHFVCIGAGAPSAEHILSTRDQAGHSDLASTVYRVYEAKKIGERAPTVGSTTMLYVAEPVEGQQQPAFRPVSPHGKAVLDHAYLTYGLKRLPRPMDINVDDNFLGSL